MFGLNNLIYGKYIKFNKQKLQAILDLQRIFYYPFGCCDQLNGDNKNNFQCEFQ